jgi:CheY-like chemotaxis protein
VPGLRAPLASPASNGYRRHVKVPAYRARRNLQPDRDRALAAGFAEHLTKPVSLSELVRTIKRFAR